MNKTARVKQAEMKGCGSMTKTAIETLEEALRAAVPDAEVLLKEPRHDGRHFEATLIAESFEGLSLLTRHRQVMDALKPLFQESLHALALKVFTPQEWEKKHNPQNGN